MPDIIRNKIWHFNVVNPDPFVGENAKPVPLKRRDYYKITLVNGSGKVNYSDKVV